MKVRQGFVSNSSSSSFLLEISPTNKCSHCGRSDPDLIDLIKQIEGNDGETEIMAEGIEDVRNYLSDDTWSERLLNIVNNLDTTIENKKIVYVSISYHNEALNDLIKTSPNIRIIDSND